MLSFLKNKLNIEPTDGIIVKTDSASEAISAEIDSVVQELKFDIYDQIRTIRDPEKPQSLEDRTLDDSFRSVVHHTSYDSSLGQFVSGR